MKRFPFLFTRTYNFIHLKSSQSHTEIEFSFYVVKIDFGDGDTPFVFFCYI